MILITSAALHAALAQLRNQVADQDRPAKAAAVAMEGLSVLASLFDPAHLPAPIPDPHPASGAVAGPVVSDGPGADAAGESTQEPPQPEEGGEPPAGKRQRERQGKPRGARPPALDRPSPWNAARDAHLAAAWERGDTVAQILHDVNAIPGDGAVPSELAIRSRVSGRKLRRGAEAMAAEYKRAAARSAGPRKWTDEAIAYVRRAYPDKAIPVEDIAPEVARMIGAPMTADGVAHFCQKHGIPRPRGQVAGRPLIGGKRNLTRWSDERRAALPVLWAQQPRLTQTQIAEALNRLPGDVLDGHAVGVYALTSMKLPKRGLLPRVDGKAPAAAAAQARASGAPPAPEAAPAAPPAIPSAPSDRTNPAGAEAVPDSQRTPGPQQPGPARVGDAPATPDSPAFAAKLGANGARIVIHAAPQTDEDPPPYDPARPGSREAKIEKALRLLRAGKDADDVRAQTKLELREILRLVGQVRQERAEQAA